ncbi:MAG: hypothetical protein R3246_14435, partial [Acidimicrobiia bacterium]|nr:hypothetical protein [Acidimicrobiia bacterium]
MDRAGGPWLVGGGVAAAVVVIVVIALAAGGGSDDPDEASGPTSTDPASPANVTTATTGGDATATTAPDPAAPTSTDASVTSTTATAPPQPGGDDELENPNLVGIEFGAISQEGVGSPAPPPEPIPQMPDWEMIELDTVESPNPEAFVDPDPVTVPAFSGAIDDFVSNAVGCQLNCIRKAVLHPSFLRAEVDIEVETNVATTLTVWMSTGSIITVND